jgi:hypothetical protein
MESKINLKYHKTQKKLHLFFYICYQMIDKNIESFQKKKIDVTMFYFKTKQQQINKQITIDLLCRISYNFLKQKKNRLVLSKQVIKRTKMEKRKFVIDFRN